MQAIGIYHMSLTREQIIAILVAIWEEGVRDIDFSNYDSIITVLSAQISVAYEYVRNYLLSIASEDIVDEKWNDGNGLSDHFDGMFYRVIEFITEHLADPDLASLLVTYMTWNGQRILDTEQTRCESEAFLSDHDTYVYHAAMDDVTCEECRALNGKTFLKSDAVIGVNLPPMHPNCRCWISES